MSNVDLSRHYSKQTCTFNQPKLLPLPADDALFTCHQLRKDNLSHWQAHPSSVPSSSASSSSLSPNDLISASSTPNTTSAPSTAPPSLNQITRDKEGKKQRLQHSGALSSDSGVLASASSSSSSVLSLSTDDNSSSCSVKKDLDLETYQGDGCSEREQIGSEQACITEEESPCACGYGQKYGQESTHATEPSFIKSTNFGLCAIDWHKGSHHNYHENKRVALISAGLTTGSDRLYVAETISNLEQLGFE